MTIDYSVNTATLSYDGGSVSASSAVPVNRQPSMLGRIGVGTQVGGALITGYAGIRQAKDDIRNANRDLAMTEAQVYDTYTQVFEDLAEQNRQMYAAQDVAVATSGLAAEGSVKAVLEEAVATAGKQLARTEKAMKSEIAAARMRAKMIKADARRSKRFSAIQTGLTLAAIGGGY